MPFKLLVVYKKLWTVKILGKHYFFYKNWQSKIANITGKLLKNVKQSAISDHLLQCNCAINFDDFSILATDCFKCYIKNERKCSFENALVEKNLFTFMDLSC